ncbi:MAG: hypothetical protein ACTSRU_17270, partial [Candidatus Hodarchaeales archaeon]
MKRSDIIIYTKAETLIHKQGLKKGEENYTDFSWVLPKMPKRFLDGNPEDFCYGSIERIYFACDKEIKGYFLLKSVDDLDPFEFYWDSRTWKDITPIPVKSFQGFKYADGVKELCTN